MRLTNHQSLRIVMCLAACLMWTWMRGSVSAQGVATTTVQGTVYLANGKPGSGSLVLSWPAFTTANNQAVTTGRMNVTIGLDGYVSVQLAPNVGSTPAGLYYTAVYHLSDGTTSTEYWVVPAAAQANLSQVRAQVMPAAQAVQAVSKSYVDQSIQELTQSLLTASGGSLSGPLYLSGDPTQSSQAANKHYVDNEFGLAVPLSGGSLTGPLNLNADPTQSWQAANKHYVDGQFAQALPLTGGAATGALTGVQLGAAFQVDQFQGADFGARLQACVNSLNPTYGGTCDARNFTGTLAMGSTVVISTPNATVQLPCATISTASQLQVTAGTRNVTLHGCALRGASDASGSAGGTVLLYSGAGAAIQVGDPLYGSNTMGFHLDDVVINTTASSSATAQGLAAYRTQEMSLGSLYLLGNLNQTGITLDGTGNYTGGTFQDLQLDGFGIALNAVGHQVANAATTDWLNASAFLRLHINCPTSGGSPVADTYGINLQRGDGNTFTGGDIEGCSTALHLGPNAQNNTIVGLRNENSTNQVVADAGSSYNNWMTGGTMFTGQLTDNGTRNSFLDTFHRSFNGLNGDWYGSQQDATVTNHFRIGTGAGNERGLLNRYQTDYGYRWTTGLSDATGGAQFYQVLDELNNVYRLSIGQFNNGQSSTNNQTVVNAAGTGAVVLNGSSNAGTGGVIFGSGGSTGATVATINNVGNAQFNGSLQVGGPSTFTASTSVKNQADAEIDSFLWAGATANQKESYIYKDYTGASQWYMVKDTNNNWALNSAIGGLDSFKAYQSNGSGDTYVNASNGTGHIRLNYESGSGAETDIYSGSSSALVAAFLGTNAIKFPGLAAGSGHNCLQIDNSGYISNTGLACGGGLNGTVNSGTMGQVAFYTGNGNIIAGTSAVGVTSGGTGASSAAQALQNLGGQPAIAGLSSDGASGLSVAGSVSAIMRDKGGLVFDVKAYGATATGVVGTAAVGTDDGPAFRSAFAAAVAAGGGKVTVPPGTYLLSSHDTSTYGTNTVIYAPSDNIHLECDPGAVLYVPTYHFINLGYTHASPYNADPNSLTNSFTLSNLYPINTTTTIGLTTITTTNPADAGNFTNGDIVLIHGGPGTESGGDSEINYVLSSDPATGNIVLKNPTTRPINWPVGMSGYTNTGTVVDRSVVKVNGFMFHDVSIKGCTVHLGGAGDFAVVGPVIGVKILNNTVYQRPESTRGQFYTVESIGADIEIAGNTYIASNHNGLVMQPNCGQRDIRIHDNLLITQGGAINPSCGVTDVEVSNNHIYENLVAGAGSSNQGAFISGTAYNLHFSHNEVTIFNDPSNVAANGIVWGLNNGSCLRCVMDNNMIHASGNITAGVVNNGGDTIIANNRITSSGAGITLSDRSTISYATASISGNQIHLTGTSGLYDGVLVSGTRHVLITNNDIWADSLYTGGASYAAIRFGGTGSAGGVISGNHATNMANFLTLGSGDSPTVTGNECLTVTNVAYCFSPGLATTGTANTFTANNTFSGGIQDFSGAAHTLPSKKGTTASIPATCTTGEEYFATDATAGQNKYFCTATNTWTQLVTGGAAGYGRVATVAPVTYSGTSGVAGGTLLTPSLAGVYRLCGFEAITVAGTGGSFYLRSKFYSDGRYQSINTGNLLTTTQWTISQSCTTFYADAGQAIQYDVLASSVTGTPTVRYALTLEQLQ